MQDFTDNLIEATIFSEGCDVSTGRFLPAILPIEALYVSQTCHNTYRKNIVTCKDPEIERFLNEVNGLEFNVQLLSHYENLPAYIPILDFGSSKMDTLPDSITHVGITLTDILRTGFSLKAGTLRLNCPITFRLSILKKCLRNKKVILFLTGEDTIIEEVWHQRNQIKLFEILKELNFYAISGINFSVFGGECAFSQVLNLKRSLFSAFLLEQNGLMAMPHVYAINQYQIDRWINWFKENPTVNYFIINCQLQKSDENIVAIQKVIQKILSSLSYMHVILQGFQTDKIIHLQTYVSRIHFADKVAVKCTNGRKKLIIDNVSNKLKRIIAKENRNSEILLNHNLKIRKSYLENCLK